MLNPINRAIHKIRFILREEHSSAIDDLLKHVLLELVLIKMISSLRTFRKRKVCLLKLCNHINQTNDSFYG
jgi:hypothetical protein